MPFKGTHSMILVNEYGQKRLVANIFYAFSIFFKNPSSFQNKIRQYTKCQELQEQRKVNLKKNVKNNKVIKS